MPLDGLCLEFFQDFGANHSSGIYSISGLKYFQSLATAGTLELHCHCCDRCCSVALLAGSSKVLASLFFRLGCSSLGQAVPAGSFHCCRSKLNWFEVTPFQVLSQKVLGFVCWTPALQKATGVACGVPPSL